MRKMASVTLVVLALLLVSAGQSDAWSRGWHGHYGGPRVVLGFGGWWGPPPYWYYPPPYYVYSPPPVVVQEPPVYVQQTPAPAPPAPPAPTQQNYWYYCAPTRDYYPNVQTCPEAWIKVAPRQD